MARLLNDKLLTMACNLIQYCASASAAAKNVYRDNCRGNIFTGTIAAAKRIVPVNTATIAAAKSKILWRGKYRSRTCTEPFAAAKNVYRDNCRGNIFTGTIAAAKRIVPVNTATIAAAKSKILWRGKYRSRTFTEPFAAAKTLTGLLPRQYSSSRDCHSSALRVAYSRSDCHTNCELL